MSFDYVGLGIDVDQLIKDFGQLVTVNRTSSGSYTPSTGAVSGSSKTSFQVYAVFVPWQEEMLDGSKYEWNKEYHWGTEIQNAEARCIMSPLDISGAYFTIGLEDEVVLADGSKMVVKVASPIKPAGVVAAWDLKVA